MLDTTDLPLSEIAARCGFYDQSHLTHVFRQKRGVTPGEYRQKSSGRSLWRQLQNLGVAVTRDA